MSTSSLTMSTSAASITPDTTDKLSTEALALLTKIKYTNLPASSPQDCTPWNDIHKITRRLLTAYTKRPTKTTTKSELQQLVATITAGKLPPRELADWLNRRRYGEWAPTDPPLLSHLHGKIESEAHHFARDVIPEKHLGPRQHFGKVWDVNERLERLKIIEGDEINHTDKTTSIWDLYRAWCTNPPDGMNPNVFILPAVWISAFLCPLVLTAKLGSVEGFDLDAIKTETVKMLIEFGRPKFQSSFNGSDNMFKSWIQGFTIAHGHLGYKLVYGRDAVEDAGPGVKNVTKKFIDFKKTGGKRKG